jgi:hypothetical protein
MGGPRSPLSALITVDEDRARKRIVAAAVSTRGCKRDMAPALGISECTLHRMIRKLPGLDAQIDAAVAECVPLPALPTTRSRKARPLGDLPDKPVRRVRVGRKKPPGGAP